MEPRKFLLIFTVWVGTIIDLCNAGAEYQGCYKENRRRRYFALTPGDYVPTNVTPNICAAKCGSYRFTYAALTAAQFCFCGNTKPPLSALDEPGCTTPCSGDATKICGSDTHISLYTTVTSITGLQITLASAGVVETGSPVTFQLSVTSMTENIAYKIDYDDGAGQMGKNATDMLSRTYNKPGVYYTTVSANDINDTLTDKVSKCAVSVQARVNNVTMDCPDYGATYEELKCYLKVADGTNMVANVSNNEGGVTTSQTINLADPNLYDAGPPIPSRPVTGVATSTTANSNGVVFSPAADVSVNGRILGLEYYATVPGNIVFLILYPYCTTGTYCYSTNQCQTAACVDSVISSCSLATPYCTSDKTCSSCPAMVNRYSNTTLGNTFKVRWAIPYTVTTIGYGYVPLILSGYDVFRGDIIAHEITGAGGRLGKIAILATDMKTDFWLSGSQGLSLPDTVVITTGATTLQERHLLKVIVSSQSSVLLPFTFTIAGTITITGTVSNQQISHSISASDVISVIEGVDYAIPNVATYVATNGTYNYQLLPHTGTNVSVQWDFGNGFVISTMNAVQPYAYTLKGVYNLTVNASNMFSSKANNTFITVQDRIINCQITPFSAIAVKGETTNIIFSLTSGSNYTVYWSFSDGSPSIQSVELVLPSGQNASFVFNVLGLVTVNANCSNDINWVSAPPIQLNVMERITGLQLQTYGAIKNVTFMINVTWITGTSVNVTISFDGVNQIVTLDPTLKKAMSPPMIITSLGVHTVTVTANNPVGPLQTLTTPFVIESEIISPSVVTTLPPNHTLLKHPLIATSSAVSFTVNAAEGTSIKVNLDYRDGTVDSFDAGIGVAWTTPTTFNHVFNTAGFFNINITLWNAFNKFTYFFPVTVMTPVRNLSIFSNSPRFFIPPGVITFTFAIDPGVAEPSSATLDFDYGDGYAQHFSTFSVTDVINRNYWDDAKTYTVVAAVCNLINCQNMTTTVTIVEIIEGLKVSSDPLAAVVGISFDAVVTAYRAGNENINLTFNFGDGTTAIAPRIGQSPLGEDRFSHIYPNNRNYTISVTATSIFQTVSASYNILVQIAVNGKYTISSSHPQMFSLGGQMNYVVTYIGLKTNLPDNPYAQFSYGDGTVSAPISLASLVNQGDSLPHTHTYSQDGDYVTTVTIFNAASSEVFQVASGVYMPFSNLKVQQICRQPFIPIGGACKTPYGTGKNIIPITEPAVFSITKTTGTLGYFEIYSQSPTDIFICNKTVTIFNVLFPVTGNFTVTVTARNPLYSAVADMSLVPSNLLIQGPVDNITVTDFGINTGAHEPKTFSISFKLLGVGMCLYVDFGDGTQMFLGDQTTCTLSLHYSSTKYSQIPAISNPMNLTHIYTALSSFEVIVEGFNSISNQSATFPFSITTIDCSKPHVDIKDGQFQFYLPAEVQRSKKVRVTGITDIYCTYTLDNTKTWTVETVDSTTGDILSQVNISFLDSAHKSELSLAPLFLPYGLYRMTYMMEMSQSSFTNGERFYDMKSAYIRIVKSELVVQIFQDGITKITRGIGTQLTIAPRNFSYDPDDPSTQLTNFTWWLRMINETYNMSDTTVVWSPGDTVITGPGRLNTNAGEITIDTNMLHVNTTYEFQVMVYKDTRSASAISYLHLINGIPPEPTIRAKIPNNWRPNPEGKKVIPTCQLNLLASCLAGCSSNMDIKWEVYVDDYRYADGWRKIEILDTYIDGIYSDELAISPKLFAFYNTKKKFQLRLFMSNAGSSVTGETSINLIVNDFPSGGNCSVTPLNGTATQTYHEFKCTGFTDEDGIAKYEFLYFDKDGLETIILSGTDTKYNDTLPLGNSNNNFYLDIYARISDTLGSSKVYYVAQVQSQPVDTATFKDTLTTLLNEKMDILDMVKARGDAKEVCKTASTYRSMMNMLSKDATSEYAGCGTAGSYTKTNLDETNRTAPFTASSNCSSAELNKAEEERDARKQLTTELAQALETVTIADMSDITQVSSTLKEISAFEEDCGRECQMSISNLVQNITKILESKWNEEGTFESILGVVTNMLSVVSSVTGATDVNQKNPSLSDKKDMDVKLKDFDTNLFSTTEDIPAGVNDFTGAWDAGRTIFNKYEQQQVAGIVNSQNEDAVDSMMDVVMLSMTKSEKPVQLKTEKSEMNIQKNAAKDLGNKTTQCGTGFVNVPPISDIMNVGENTTVAMKVETTVNVAGAYKGGGPGVISDYAGSLSLAFYDDNGKEISVANLTTMISLFIPLDPFIPLPDLVYANPVIPDREWEHLFYHRMERKDNFTSVHAEFRPQNTSVQFIVFIRFGALPNVTTDEYDYFCMIPDSMANKDFYGDKEQPDPYTCFIDSDEASKYPAGNVYFGVRQLAPSEQDMYTTRAMIPKFAPGTGRFTTDYTIRTYTASCPYYDKTTGTWKTAGTTVGPLTSTRGTHCYTSHLTTFAGGWAVAPNNIDWNFVFSNMDFYKNPTIYVTMMVITVVYIAAVIWARHQDKQDLTKLGLAPLLDNDARDKYYYEIMVSTGMRKDAGTHSKVHFILSGEEEETDVRTFTDTKRKIFQRGSTDGFLMSVSNPLGALMYLRIWHDNSGKGKFASWYLNHIIIRDIQTDKKYFFIVNRWFAVEEDDGQVDRVIPVAGKEQMTEFNYQFQQQASKNLSDGHLWFSVVARPPQSRFTRVQRVSCCLCLLYMTMLANAMFYEKGDSSRDAFTFGPFALTPEQIFIGVASNLIIFPVSFLIITIFRKARPRRKRPSRVGEAIRNRPIRTTSVADVHAQMKSSMDFDRGESSLLKRPDTSMSRPDTSLSTVSQSPSVHGKKKKFELPWYFIIIAWILLWASVLVSAAFVLFYGIMFQDLKCKKWITSMLISFFTSVFITQPIKVFLFAIVLSLIVKNPGGNDEEEEDEEEECHIAKDEELLHQDDAFGYARPTKAGYKPKPPNSKQLVAARIQRLKEIQMWAVIREIIFYAFFLWILMVVSYRNRDQNSYYYKYSLQQIFILTSDTGQSFTDIENQDHFWLWAKTGMIRGLRAGPYYNQDPPFFLRGYINDKVSRLMGYATMRQLRVSPASCKVAPEMKVTIHECNDNYDMMQEEDKSFSAGWNPLTGNSTLDREEYQYQSASSLNGYPYWGQMVVYGGGGYVVRLNKNYNDTIKQFEQLENEGWIDRYTRAVFVEFTVYNPSINLFSICTLLAEFRPSQGIFPSYRFEPAMLLPYMDSAMLFQIACEIVYLLFVVLFVGKLIRDLYKERTKYFTEFWNWIELGICSMSVTASVIYFYRLFEVNKLTAYFKETHGNEYMKFQSVGYWSEIFTYIIGWLVFFASLKFLKLLRFNKKISLLASTLKNSGRDLMHFSIIFNIVFLAFIQLFYLIYVKNVSDFKTFITAIETGIVMMMGKFDMYNMLMVNPVITQVFIFLFVVTITFIVVNMFLSILNEAFTNVRNNANKQNNDYEIVDFMMNRFKMWTGIGTPAPNPITPGSQENERTRPYNSIEGQIEYFPSQIDRFLSSISNMYMQKHQFDEFLAQGEIGNMALKARMARDAPPPIPRPRFSGKTEMTAVQT
ncbi:hypothetical protein ACJMK2_034186 [Sinanodonta woodiana]|uniref:Uncharacterized protein n=1 Tax=Sinanodonta woodiana TaxID=1069815 RepID=A0ABD3WQS1_SINWO